MVEGMGCDEGEQERRAMKHREARLDVETDNEDVYYCLSTLFFILMCGMTEPASL